uniref:Ig-like domain-containing protein n=1 Tax=Gadus morhua TaxID=8049 RepID=A0A8C5CCG2_GADMO
MPSHGPPSSTWSPPCTGPRSSSTALSPLNPQGEPFGKVSWSLPDGTVINNALQSDDSGVRNRRFVIFDNGTLLLQQMGKKDEGDYTCHAKNKLGRDERKVKVTVTPDAPKISPESHLLATARLSLPCSVDDWQQASISWTLPNGRLLDKPQHTGRLSFFANGTLQLKEVATFDKGTYVCKASNTFGSHTLSYPVTVMVFPPRITKAPASVTRIHRGSPVTLGCLASGVPKPEISWTLPGRTTLVLVIQNPITNDLTCPPFSTDSTSSTRHDLCRVSNAGCGTVRFASVR